MITSCVIQYLLPLIPLSEYMCWFNGAPPNITPPYFDELKPILPNDGVCGINNSGGRADICDADTGFAEDIVYYWEY